MRLIVIIIPPKIQEQNLFILFAYQVVMINN